MHFSHIVFSLEIVYNYVFEMAIFHDEVEIEDFEYDEETETYYYPCPCGDRFEISKEMLQDGEDVATCPSCSLIVKVIYDIVSLKFVLLIM